MTRSSKVVFAKHYGEMVLVMFAGMFVLGGALLLIAAGLGAGPDALQEDAPGLVLLGMGFSMTAPMVWWMHRRGHTWSANRAMAAAMILPTAATILFLVTGVIDDLDTLLGIEHIAMFPAMFVAMLPYRTEYTYAHAKRPATASGAGNRKETQSRRAWRRSSRYRSREGSAHGRFHHRRT
jgi:hypothetical protein